MSRVSFYFNVKDRSLALCQLAGKAVNQGLTLGILVESASAASEIDELLWRVPETGFMPHCPATHPLAAKTPTLLSTKETALNGRDVLFNLTQTPCDHPENHKRIIEIVARDDESGRTRARQHVRHYQATGIAVDFTDMAAREN